GTIARAPAVPVSRDVPHYGIGSAGRDLVAGLTVKGRVQEAIRAATPREADEVGIAVRREGDPRVGGALEVPAVRCGSAGAGREVRIARLILLTGLPRCQGVGWSARRPRSRPCPCRFRPCVESRWASLRARPGCDAACRR